MGARIWGLPGFLPSGTCEGDFNNNGSCGSDDLLFLLLTVSAQSQNWLRIALERNAKTGPGPYDMDDSNVVEVNDLLLFLQR